MFKCSIQVSILFYFIFWLCYSACGILVSLPGIKPASLALEVQSLNHWTTREIPNLHSFLDPSAILYVGDTFCFYGIRLLLSRTPPSPEFLPSSQVTSSQYVFLNVCWLWCLSSVLDVFLLPTNSLSRRLLFILKNLKICVLLALKFMLQPWLDFGLPLLLYLMFSIRMSNLDLTLV